MARVATRPVRGLVALVFVAASATMVSNFATFGGSVKHSPRTTRTTANGIPVRLPLPAMTPLPWTEDLEGSEALQNALARDTQRKVDGIVQHIIEVDMGLHGIAEPTKEQLYEYDRTLSSNIQMLVEQIEKQQSELTRDSMEVRSEMQLLWLESVLQTVGEMKEQLSRVRAAHGSVHSRLAREERGFFEKIMHSAACLFGGSKVLSNSDYPASDVSSFTGEPSAML